jgi:hypothetical protein
MMNMTKNKMREEKLTIRRGFRKAGLTYEFERLV